MADDNDNGQDPNLELAPIKRGPGGRPVRAPEPEPKTNDVAAALSKVLAAALGDVVAKEPEVRLPEDRGEVRLRANRPFHVAAEHLARSQLEGTAYGMDGMGIALEQNQLFIVRPGAHVDWLLDNGFARPERAA
jgi:hypothetical protein